MNAPLELRLSRREFLTWVDGRDGRFELKDGRVVMLTGGTKDHAGITQRIAARLSLVLDPTVWAVTTADLAVEVGDAIRYPDIVVEPLDSQGKSLVASRPTVIFEVLSTSTVGVNFTEKHAEYTELVSLAAYIIVSQDEPIVWTWERNSLTAAYPSTPKEIAGRGASIEIAALGVGLPLAEVFLGIGIA